MGGTFGAAWVMKESIFFQIELGAFSPMILGKELQMSEMI